MGKRRFMARESSGMGVLIDFKHVPNTWGSSRFTGCSTMHETHLCHRPMPCLEIAAVS